MLARESNQEQAQNKKHCKMAKWVRQKGPCKQYDSLMKERINAKLETVKMKRYEHLIFRDGVSSTAIWQWMIA